MVEPLDVTCLHSVTLYLTYSTDLPMYMYQALLAALLSPIVVADGEYLVSLFVKYTTMQYVNLLIELPSIRRQQSQQIQTQYRRKYKACTKLVPEKNECYVHLLNSTSGILPQSVRDNFYS